MDVKMPGDCGNCKKRLDGRCKNEKCVHCKSVFCKDCVDLKGFDDNNQYSCKICFAKNGGRVMAANGVGVHMARSADQQVLDAIHNLAETMNSKMEALERNIKAEFNKMAGKIAELENSQADLGQRVSSTESYHKKLEEKIAKLEAQVEQQAEYGRRETLVITGVPEDENEDLFEIVKRIGSVLKLTIYDSQISAVHRLPTKSAGPKQIIVKFANRWMADDIKQRRRRTTITADMLNFHDKSEVNITVSLTRAKSYLLMKARLLFKNKGYVVKVNDKSVITVRKKYANAEEAKTKKYKSYQISSEEDFTSILDQLQKE